jgi:hypothetical protein
MIPERLFEILKSCQDEKTSCFPPTEVFNEGWMLRLILDAIQTLKIPNHSLQFFNEAKWYSEALLYSPFRPRSKPDPLGEGLTHADGVIGHFEFHPSTKAGLLLKPGGQFVVVEAKMFSNLSSGTTNAPGYNQAARNVACMAEAIARSGRFLSDFKSVGFFVIAPNLETRQYGSTNLETCLTPDSIRSTVNQRIESYEFQSRKEARELRKWQDCWFLPLLDRLVNEQHLAVLAWESLIEVIANRDRTWGEDLHRFYQCCLTFNPHHKPIG